MRCELMLGLRNVCHAGRRLHASARLRVSPELPRLLVAVYTALGLRMHLPPTPPWPAPQVPLGPGVCSWALPQCAAGQRQCAVPCVQPSSRARRRGGRPAGRPGRTRKLGTAACAESALAACTTPDCCDARVRSPPTVLQEHAHAAARLATAALTSGSGDHGLLALEAQLTNLTAQR